MFLDLVLTFITQASVSELLGEDAEVLKELEEFEKLFGLAPTVNPPIAAPLPAVESLQMTTEVCGHFTSVDCVNLCQASLSLSPFPSGLDFAVNDDLFSSFSLEDFGSVVCPSVMPVFE
jgi:hypothetical protein